MVTERLQKGSRAVTEKQGPPLSKGGPCLSAYFRLPLRLRLGTCMAGREPRPLPWVGP